MNCYPFRRYGLDEWRRCRDGKRRNLVFRFLRRPAFQTGSEDILNEVRPRRLDFFQRIEVAMQLQVSD